MHKALCQDSNKLRLLPLILKSVVQFVQLTHILMSFKTLFKFFDNRCSCSRRHEGLVACLMHFQGCGVLGLN